MLMGRSLPGCQGANAKTKASPQLKALDTLPSPPRFTLHRLLPPDYRHRCSPFLLGARGALRADVSRVQLHRTTRPIHHTTACARQHLCWCHQYNNGLWRVFRHSLLHLRPPRLLLHVCAHLRHSWQAQGRPGEVIPQSQQRCKVRCFGVNVSACTDTFLFTTMSHCGRANFPLTSPARLIAACARAITFSQTIERAHELGFRPYQQLQSTHLHHDNAHHLVPPALRRHIHGAFPSLGAEIHRIKWPQVRCNVLAPRLSRLHDCPAPTLVNRNHTPTPRSR